MFKPVHILHIGLAVAAIFIGYKLGWRAMTVLHLPPIGA